MGWFNRKKKEEEWEELFSTVTNEVPLSTIVRWFIYDIGYGDRKVDDLIGLPPISDEGKEKELEDSRDRLDSIQPLVPFIDFISNTSANVFAYIALQIESKVPEAEREETEELLGNLYKSIALSSIIGALSISNALGMIDITAFAGDIKKVDLEDMQDE